MKIARDMKKREDSFPIVKVTWEDASGKDSGWISLEEINGWGDDISTVSTVGFLIKKDKKCIVVAHSKGKDFWGGVTRIFLKMVQKIKYLEG